MSADIARPTTWLVVALPWPNEPEGRYAECAVAFAPANLPAQLLSEEADTARQFAIALSRQREESTIFFADMTGVLREKGRNWSDVGVHDVDAVLAELRDPPSPSLVLTLSEYAHMLLCNAGTRDVYVYGAAGGNGERVADADFAEMRAQLRAQLQRDWPPYIERLRRAGKIATV